MNHFELFLFGVYPYVVVMVCLVGCIIRYDREPYTWKADSSQMMSKKNTRLANNLFHVGILGIVFGHTIGMFTPHWMYESFITSGQKQLLAMVAGGISGVLVLAGLYLMIKRRFNDPRISKMSSFGDKAILILLMVQVLLGLGSIPVSAGHLDGHMMEGIGTYFQSAFSFDMFNGYAAIAHVSWIYKMHILVGYTIILVIPFTRLVHAFSAPIWYLGRNYQIVRARFHK